MAYNNGFPMNYPQFYPQFPQGQQSQQQGNFIWVQGEAGAKSYLLAPNTTLPLWDSEQQTIYLKSADASGMPSMKILDYKIRESMQNQNKIVEEPKIDYVTHEELKAFEDKLMEQMKEVTGA
jgi:hypothetical protein